MMAAPNITAEYADEYIGYELVDFASAMIGILICFVSLRFIARIISRTSFGTDDYLTIPALVSVLALCGVSIGMYNGELVPNLAKVFGMKCRRY